mgnify:CR=1 FL=1
MKKIILSIILSLIYNNVALSETLSEALLKAYKNNTQLNAERENINVSREDLNISKSDYLPSFSITSSKSREDTNKITDRSGNDTSVNDVDPLTTTIKLEQTLIDLGRSADFEKNKIGLSIAQAKLLNKVQSILYKATEAYTGLIAANEKFLINKRNVDLLERQVETDRILLDNNQITLSDLAQSESSLAGAQAKLIESKNSLNTSKLIYENIIGPVPNFKNLAKPKNENFVIPQTLEEVIRLSKAKNPDLIIAKLEYEKSIKDVEISRSDLAPTASLSLERSYTDDLSSSYDEREKDILKATVNWPFYSGGKKRATINKNQNLKAQKKLLLDNEIKTNETNVTSALFNLQSTKSFLKSVQSQVRAAEIANEGINAEYESGIGRTTFEVIQSNILLLNAKISLVDSERNYLLAQYNLLKSIGLLNSDYLKLR